MKKTGIFAVGLLGVVLAASSTFAQESPKNEVSVQAIGVFTKDSNGNGVKQHTSDSGGFLVGYRYKFTDVLGVEGNYGLNRSTLYNQLTPGFRSVQTDNHQITGAVVLSTPRAIGLFRPYALAGAGALVFSPTDIAGPIDSQTKAAFLYGGGTDVEFSKNVALRLEYRGFVYGRPDFGITALKSDATAHTAQPSAGIVFKF